MHGLLEQVRCIAKFDDFCVKPLIETCSLILRVRFRTYKEGQCSLPKSILISDRPNTEIKNLVKSHIERHSVAGSLRINTREALDLIIERLTRDDSWVEEYQQSSCLHVPSFATEDSEKARFLHDIADVITLSTISFLILMSTESSWCRLVWQMAND